MSQACTVGCPGISDNMVWNTIPYTFTQELQAGFWVWGLGPSMGQGLTFQVRIQSLGI